MSPENLWRDPIIEKLFFFYFYYIYKSINSVSKLKKYLPKSFFSLLLLVYLRLKLNNKMVILWLKVRTNNSKLGDKSSTRMKYI